MPENPAVSDTYTGELTPRGTPQRRTLPGATIIKASVGPMDNNCYLLTCARTGSSVLVDAANDAGTLLELVAAHAPDLALIVTTHQHRDHWQALAEVARATGAPTAAHPLDAEALPVAPDTLLQDGDTVRVGDLSLEVVHLRGHTPGSVALALGAGDRTHLFTGDSLFPGGVGKTRSPQDFTTLYGDVTAKLFDRFDDDTWVYPGHGRDTTLGAERPHLAQWRARGW